MKYYVKFMSLDSEDFTLYEGENFLGCLNLYLRAYLEIYEYNRKVIVSEIHKQEIILGAIPPKDDAHKDIEYNVKFIENAKKELVFYKTKLVKCDKDIAEIMKINSEMYHKTYYQVVQMLNKSHLNSELSLWRFKLEKIVPIKQFQDFANKLKEVEIEVIDKFGVI